VAATRVYTVDENEPISSDAKEYSKEPMIMTLQEHITLGAEDLSADDWFDIEDY